MFPRIWQERTGSRVKAEDIPKPKNNDDDYPVFIWDDRDDDDEGLFNDRETDASIRRKRQIFQDDNETYPDLGWDVTIDADEDRYRTAFAPREDRSPPPSMCADTSLACLVCV